MNQGNSQSEYAKSVRASLRHAIEARMFYLFARATNGRSFTLAVETQ